MAHELSRTTILDIFIPKTALRSCQDLLLIALPCEIIRWCDVPHLPVHKKSLDYIVSVILCQTVLDSALIKIPAT